MLKKFCIRCLISFFVFLIKAYQKVLSPLSLSSCRYLPTCSQYAVEAYEKRGLFMGTWFTFKRLFSCHPFTESRVDEVP